MFDIGANVEQMIIRQSKLSGQPVPERIQNAPQLMEGLQFEFQAFFELDPERNHAFGFTLIPLSKIREYGQLYDMQGEELEEFVSIIHRLDSAHIARLESKRPKTNGANNSSKSGQSSNSAD